jgi:hypothetical protein
VNVRAVLVHWNRDEGLPRLAALHAAGWDGELVCEFSLPALRAWAADPPDAILIDLSRRPSHGKEVATVCRERKALRQTPLVFLEGDPERVAALREGFPGAQFTLWSRLRSALRAASKPRAPEIAPPAPRSYSSSLPKKLGIVEGAAVLALEPPPDWEATLGILPPGVTLSQDPGGPSGVVLAFLRSRQQLVETLPAAGRACAPRAKLWLLYPKKSSGIATDLTQEFLREYALTHSWVDYKVCSFDQTWTGFCFSRRKE